MNLKLVISGAILAAVSIVGYASIFTVRETSQVLVIQLGEPKRLETKPGLHFKLPLIQKVVHVEKRVLDLDPPVEDVILADQRRLQVDAFARYRIVDAQRFYEAIGGGTDFTVMQQRLNTRMTPQLRASMRSQLGNVTLLGLLSDEREVIFTQIIDVLQDAISNFGIEVLDVRIRRADLPPETSNAIYERMKSEREREAAEFRAQGKETADQIRARAERERTVILAEARREAQIIRGEGDNEAIKVLAESYNQDSEFFAFYRSLQAYKKTLSTENTTLVLSPDSEFFRYFKNFPNELQPDSK